MTAEFCFIFSLITQHLVDFIAILNGFVLDKGQIWNLVHLQIIPSSRLMVPSLFPDRSELFDYREARLLIIV